MRYILIILFIITVTLSADGGAAASESSSVDVWKDIDACVIDPDAIVSEDAVLSLGRTGDYFIDTGGILRVFRRIDAKAAAEAAKSAEPVNIILGKIDFVALLYYVPGADGGKQRHGLFFTRDFSGIFMTSLSAADWQNIRIVSLEDVLVGGVEDSFTCRLFQLKAQVLTLILDAKKGRVPGKVFFPGVK